MKLKTTKTFTKESRTKIIIKRIRVKVEISTTKIINL